MSALYLFAYDAVHLAAHFLVDPINAVAHPGTSFA
jgi:hypothetical protein